MPRTKIQDLIDKGIIIDHKDGNFGSFYPRQNEFGAEGVPFLTAKLLDDSGRLYLDRAPRLNYAKANKLTFGWIKEDDVLLSHNATVGRVALVPNIQEKMLVGTSLTYFRLDKNKLLPSYFATYISSKDFQNQLRAVMSYSTRDQVPITIQRNLFIEIPDYSTQVSIGNIHSIFSRRIELLRQTNKNLEDIAKLIFKSWFINFDPVKAKEKGLSTELTKDISDLFPDSFENTELGEIPKNWKFVDLQEIADFQNGYAFKSNEYINKNESSLEIFRMGYINRGGGFKEDNSPVFVENSSNGYQKKYFLERDDLTIAMTDMKNKMVILGCCALIEESKRFLLNQRVGRIRVKDSKIIDSKYLYLYMNYPRSIEKIRSKSNSGVQVNLSTDAIKSTQILIPEISVMERFSKITKNLFSTIIKNNTKIKLLIDIRDNLLPKLISGELKIPDAKKMIEEVGI